MKSHVLLAVLLWSATSAFAQDRPFLFSVGVRSDPSQPALHVDYDVGAGERLFQSSRANEPERRVAAEASWRRFTLIGRFGVITSGTPHQSAQSAEMLVSVVDQRRAGVAMAAGGGVLREPDGTDVLLARIVAAHDRPTWRVHGNVLLQRPLDPRRDAVDLAITTGWSHRLTPAISVGVEEVAEDLEGFWDPREAEGGARLLVGPSLHFAPAGRAWQFTATGGPAFHPAGNGRVSDALRDLPASTAPVGYAVRLGLTYRVF